MASDLLSIAASGAKVARAALDVTSQNIANASTDGYVRRGVKVDEVAATGAQRTAADISLSGARVSAVVRNADAFRQSEVRRTGSDAARADTEVSGLEDLESATENAGVYDAITGFTASLKQLATDPTDGALRANVMAQADTLASSFNIAAQSVSAVVGDQQFAAAGSVDDANTAAAALAKLNLNIARTTAGSSDQAALFDQRDTLLEKLSGIVDISTTFADNGVVTVTSGGQDFVSGGQAQNLAMTTNPDGTLAFSLGGTAVSPTGGSLAGNELVLEQAATVKGKLDSLADTLSTTVNDAQADGTALDGSAGQAIFGGSGAAGIALVQTDGAALATAPAGAAAGSADGSNLAPLRTAFDASGVSDGMNDLLFDVSSRVSSRTVTRDALDTIAASAKTAVSAQSGVNLDSEAANLVRYQQAFQACGKAMQVASEIFDSMLSIG